MGQKETKFKGPGKVLGTGEVVAAPKRTSLFAPVNQAAQKAGANHLKSLVARNKPKVQLSETEKDERRKAAAAAAQAREKAWDEKIARQRAKYEKEESSGERRAWNETSPPVNLPPLDPEVLRKQKEAADALQRSGFNPFQATVASSSTARSIITNMNIDDSASSKDASIDVLYQARSKLKAAMQGSDISALREAFIEAEKYDVPEVEEARDLLLALSEVGVDTDESQRSAYEEVSNAIVSFIESNESEEKKAAASTTVKKLLRNLLDHPEDPKFRKIRLDNKAIKEKILDAAQGTAVNVLLAVGFEHVTDEENQNCLVVPDPSTLPAEVVAYARGACEFALTKL